MAERNIRGKIWVVFSICVVAYGLWLLVKSSMMGFSIMNIGLVGLALYLLENEHFIENNIPMSELRLFIVSVSGVERFEDDENYFVSTIYVIAKSGEQAKELALDYVVADEIDEVTVEEVSMMRPQVLGRC